jgi:ubiquitin-protein ligase
MSQYQIYFDTVEGEKKYNVDIGDDEHLEEVLHDLLVELSERGHMMRGLSTGDLKVVWGGREGRELDLSRSLPEQGIQPNEVLRVLVELYEGGAGSLRADRIEKEWRMLERFSGLNADKLEVLERRSHPDEEIFHIQLSNSPGIAALESDQPVLRNRHRLRFVYPRFYPEMPIECYVEEPLFHPNVKPETGFLCLWEQSSPRHSVIQAIARAHAMAAYRMVNLGGPHLMNHRAGEWYKNKAMPGNLVPLSWDELKVFQIQDGRIAWLEPGRSL